MRFTYDTPSPLSSPFAARRITALVLMMGVGMTSMAATAGSDAPPSEPAKAAAATPQATEKAKAPQKFTLMYRAKAGRIKRAKTTANLMVEVNGNKLALDLKQSDKATFTTVSKSGEITIESTTESSEVSINGNKAPEDSEDKKDVGTTVIKPNGMLVSYKTTDEDKDQSALGLRIRQASTPVFPEKAVGIGDKWSQEFKANFAMGTRDGKADFEVVGTETIKGVEAIKLKMTYAEQGASPITCTGTFVLEGATGDTLTAEYKVEGLPLPLGPQPVPATGVIIEERTEGGPLPAAEVAKLMPPTNSKQGSDLKSVAGAKNEPKKIDDVVKEYQKLPGVLTLYRKKEAVKDTIYLEIPEDKLGRLMMLQATASTGTNDQIVAGAPINDILFKFDRSGDDKILMVVPNYAFTAKNKEIARAIKRSFAEGYLQAFKIEAQQAERKSVLIDVSDLFRGDIAQISQAFAGSGLLSGLGGGGGFGLDREKTYIRSIKNLPDNLVVSTHYHFMRGGRASAGSLADARSAPIIVSYNLFALPVDNGYMPRLADGRVGYFINSVSGYPDIQSFDDDSKEDPFIRYINRWNLQKKNPAAPLSAPVKPIVFWLDNAIPLEYRDAVRGGILSWNKAFEKIGFKDAIVVNQMPDDADWDTADMRYNVIRWVVSPDQAYAVAQARTNPLTGEVLNASITVDAGIVHYTKLEHKSQVEPATAYEMGAGILQAQKTAQMAEEAKMLGGIDVVRRRAIQETLLCNKAGEARKQAWYGHLALSMMAPGGTLPPEQEKRYTDQFIRETVAHEFGHILGLRHNFIASTEMTLAQLKDPAKTSAQGTGASVMDYNPFNIAALKSPGADYFSQTVGSYDLWAIEYGYTPVADAKTPEAEVPALKAIARKNTLPGHGYQSDEIADRFDPLVTRFDLSANPLDYWEKNIQTTKYLLANLETRKPKNGESYHEFTKAFNQLLGIYARSAGVASRYIGGLNVNRNYKGDPNEKATLAPIAVAEQKRALNLLNTYIFSPKAMNFPASYYSKLTNDPFDLYGTLFGQVDFPIGDKLANIQKTSLRNLFSGSVLTRVANNEFKMGGDATKALTLPYLFNSVNQNVWAELATPTKNVPTLRRQLQRTHLDTMVDMVMKGGVPEDARMLAWGQLRQLKTKLAAAQKANTGANEYTRIHLTDSLDKVNRVLSAGITLNSGGGSSAPSLMQLLMGGKDSNGNPVPSAPATQQ